MSNFEDYFDTNIAKQVRKFRLIADLTQEELSLLLNKNIKYIGHIERGERKISRKGQMEIMDFLKIQPSDFYNFDDEYIWE